MRREVIKIKAIIPAAGYATRLYPLTKDTPKALLEVKGKPILEHIIKRVLELDVKEIYIVTNARFYKNFAEWKNGFSCKVPVKLVNDGTLTNEARLGQIGDIMLVMEKANINEDLLVVAGDNLFNFSLKPLYELFRKKRNNMNALHDVKSIEVARQLGTATIDKNSKITDFKEKAPNPDSTLASTGIYLIPKEKLKLFSEYIDDGNPPDKMGYFMAWLMKHYELYGFVYKEKWFDIGWLEALKQTEKEFTP